MVQLAATETGPGRMFWISGSSLRCRVALNSRVVALQSDALPVRWASGSSIKSVPQPPGFYSSFFVFLCLLSMAPTLGTSQFKSLKGGTYLPRRWLISLWSAIHRVRYSSMVHSSVARGGAESCCLDEGRSQSSDSRHLLVQAQHVDIILHYLSLMSQQSLVLSISPFKQFQHLCFSSIRVTSALAQTTPTFHLERCVLLLISLLAFSLSLLIHLLLCCQNSQYSSHIAKFIFKNINQIMLLTWF